MIGTRRARRDARRCAVAAVVVCFGLSGCATAGAADPDDEWGLSGPLSPTLSLGKLDTELRCGLPVATDTTRTQGWTARNRWEDTDMPAARAAGLAWPASSGLTWGATFSRPVASLAWIPSVDGDAMTVDLATPWGKILSSPMLECAETSLFLRITFAAWYELPLVLETQDDHGRLVYFGHDGVRTTAGRYARSPEFAVAYRDDTGSSGWRTCWPSDAVLRGKRIAGGSDDQAELAGGAHLGAYLDEVHLNKRVGYFTVMVRGAQVGSHIVVATPNGYLGFQVH